MYFCPHKQDGVSNSEKVYLVGRQSSKFHTPRGLKFEQRMRRGANRCNKSSTPLIKIPQKIQKILYKLFELICVLLLCRTGVVMYQHLAKVTVTNGN